MNFAQNLRRHMKDHGLKMIELSKATGISMSTLSEWTSGRMPKVSKNLLTLCDYFGVTLDEMILGRNHPGEHVAAETLIKLNGEEFRLTFTQPKDAP